MTGRDPFEGVERELAVLLRRARGRWGQLATEVHPELDPAAYGLMLRLDEVGSARMTDLADYFGVGKPTVSRQVQLLERLGLVVRSADANDGRAQVLELTTDGLARVNRVRQERRRRFRTLLEDWPADDVQTLGRLLGRLNATIE